MVGKNSTRGEKIKPRSTITKQNAKVSLQGSMNVNYSQDRK